MISIWVFAQWFFWENMKYPYENDYIVDIYFPLREIKWLQKLKYKYDHDTK